MDGWLIEVCCVPDSSDKVLSIFVVGYGEGPECGHKGRFKRA